MTNKNEFPTLQRIELDAFAVDLTGFLVANGLWAALPTRAQNALENTSIHLCTAVDRDQDYLLAIGSGSDVQSAGLDCIQKLKSSLGTSFGNSRSTAFIRSKHSLSDGSSARPADALSSSNNAMPAHSIEGFFDTLRRVAANYASQPSGPQPERCTEQIGLVFRLAIADCWRWSGHRSDSPERRLAKAITAYRSQHPLRALG